MKSFDMNQWSRREWLGLAAGCAAAPRLAAAELSGFYYRDYSKCLSDYLSGLAREAYQKRNRALELLTDAAASHKRQNWVRETFWKLVGGQPQRTPLNARVTGEFERARYRVQKVVYESRPGIVISANLYIPKTGPPPYPGVLFQMGHSPLGKAYEPYQKCCQGLVQLGYLVLAFDPMGQGERIAYPNASGTDTRLSSVDEEHTHPGKQLLLLGDSASRYQVWDAIRSLDYLAAHPMVDPKRLASTGQSGGGTLTMLLACVDSRLSAAAVSSGNTEDVACAHFNPPGSTDDAEQDLIGSGTVGFDRWDLLYPIAPKPLLVQVSSHDFFGTYSPRYLDDGREEYRKLARVYEILGKSDQLGWRSTPLPHALGYDLRLDIYNWFERWLKNTAHEITEEPPVAPEPMQTLWTGPTGSVTRDFGSLRPFDLIQRGAKTPRAVSSSKPWQEQLQFVLPTGCKLAVLTTAKMAGARVAAAEVNSAAEVWVPVWLFTPDKPDPNVPALIVLDDRGRNVGVHEDGVYHKLARSGRVVCAADIRGVGDMQPEVGRGNPRYTIPHDREEEFAWASLILGSPLLAQRIVDIVAVAQALKSDPVAANRRIALAARGRLTVPALFAFNVDKGIDSLYLAGGLVSYQNLLETEMYRQSLANFGWDLFHSTDLPLLASQSAPRKVRIAGAMSAASDALPVEGVRRVYGSENVTVWPAADWNEAALRSV
ncbi:MAG TPA: acetylxylan esterase [Bryobacteraceae bacterium]|jgi:dienelactone hydrolase|nr:acetylxylan esterase [Bryobacteraceae bacterium]